MAIDFDKYLEEVDVEEVKAPAEASPKPIKLVDTNETARKASAEAEQNATVAPTPETTRADAIDFDKFLEEADVTNTESKPLMEAPSNATPEQKQEYDATQVKGAQEAAQIRQDVGLAPLEKLPTDVDKAIERNDSDVATYRSVIVPELEKYREEYMEAYPKAIPEEREKYAEQQVMKNQNVTKEWLDKAKAGKTKLTSKQQGKLIDAYYEKYVSGEYENPFVLKKALEAEGYDGREIDIATRRMPNRTSYSESVQDVENEGYGTVASYLLGAADYIKDNYDIHKSGNYTPLQQEKGQELMVVNMFDELIGMTNGIGLFVGEDVLGMDLQESDLNKRQTKRVNRDITNDELVGPLARAGGYAPSLAAQVAAPYRATKSLFSNASAVHKLVKHTIEASMGGVMLAGELKFEQRKSDMAAQEIMAWGVAITMLPSVLAMSIAIGKAVLGPVIRGAKNIAGGQEALAWRYVKNTLTDDELAQLPQMLTDMEKAGLFTHESEVQKLLLAASRLRPQLAKELANELKYNRHAQKEFLNYYRAISKATGTAKETSQAAATALDELIDNINKMTKGANQAKKDLVDKAGTTGDNVVFKVDAQQTLDDMKALPPSLPRSISEGIERLTKGDKDEQITVKMVQDIMDSLKKYGEDTNNYAAKILARDLKVTRDDIITSSGLDLGDAQDLINQAASADAASKIINKMLKNNTFGKMFTKANKEGAWNLDTILKGKLDVGKLSHDLDAFLDTLPAAHRLKFENIIVDIFAQAFDKSSKAAQTLKISDFGKLANSIHVFKESAIQSPEALAKLDLLETLARISEFDGELAASILRAPAGDILSEKALVDGIGFGVMYKVAKNIFDKFAGRVLEGSAYRRQLKKILDEVNYAPRNTSASGQMNDQDRLLQGLYDTLVPISRTPSPGAGRNFPRNTGGDTRVKPTGAMKELWNTLQDKIRYRNQVVNTMFFRKYEGEPLDAPMIGKIADAIDAGEVRVGAGEVLPIPGQNGQMYSVGTQLKFKSTYKLAKAMRTGQKVKLTDVLPEKYNKDFYKNFPDAKNIEIAPYAKGTDPAEGGHMDVWNREIGANVENAETVGPMQANIDLSGNTIRQDISNILHEIQHYLAAIEKLPQGGGDTTIAKIKATLPASIAKSATKHGQSVDGHAYSVLFGEQMSEVTAGGRTVVGKDGKRYVTLDYSHEGPSVQTKRDLAGGKPKVTTKVVPGLTEQHEKGLRDMFGDESFDNPLALRKREAGETNVQPDDYTPISREDREALNSTRKPAIDPYIPAHGAGIEQTSKAGIAYDKLARKHKWTERTKLSLPHFEKLLRNEGVSKKEIDLLLTPLKKRLADQKKKHDMYMALKDKGMTDTMIEDEFGRSWLSASKGKPDDKIGINMLSATMDTYKPQVKPHPSDQNSYSGIAKNFEDPGQQETRILQANEAMGQMDAHSTGAKGSLGWSRAHPDVKDGEPVWVLDEFQSDWAQGLNKDSYPIDYSDFKKIMIVDGIDQAIKNNMTKVIIPIDRSGALYGSPKVSQMYSDLQKGILPKIRTQLGKKGLKIETKVVKEPIENSDRVRLAQRYLNSQGDALDHLSRDEQMAFNREVSKLEGSYLFPTSSELRAKVNTIKKEYGIKTETPDIYGNEVEKHFEINIEPKYKVDMRSNEGFLKEYRKANEVKAIKEVPDDAYIALDSLDDLTDAQQSMLRDLEMGETVHGFDEMDVFFDASDNFTISKALADDMGLGIKGKLYKSKDLDGNLIYNDLRGVDAKELGFVDNNLVDAMRKDAVVDIMGAIERANVDDDFSSFVVERMLKRVKTPEEAFEWIRTNTSPTAAEEIITDIRITLEDLAEESGGSLKTPTDIAKENFVKTRWDMFGLVGALGLSSQMETLKNNPKEQ